MKWRSKEAVCLRLKFLSFSRDGIKGDHQNQLMNFVSSFSCLDVQLEPEDSELPYQIIFNFEPQHSSEFGNEEDLSSLATLSIFHSAIMLQCSVINGDVMDSAFLLVGPDESISKKASERRCFLCRPAEEWSFVHRDKK